MANEEFAKKIEAVYHDRWETYGRLCILSSGLRVYLAARIVSRA
jgi:hypothetical protein